ncbi:hypothetical protein O181_095347 [Austropuccinia psidii MF-1]|uniref:Uncharacterized protein n=1 Tax=Austropuccinia psidii MF-1 TaxID=1389203 RepID=A0A9Q3J566_9BASI|nr:hypothetical protein [Austropuccinia psidii MF-1]
MPIISALRGTPNNLKIDFYELKYLKKLTNDERWTADDSSQVAFLPGNLYVADEMVPPDKEMPDKEFSNKHWETITKKYDIPHQIDSPE